MNMFPAPVLDGLQREKFVLSPHHLVFQDDEENLYSSKTEYTPGKKLRYDNY